MDYIRLLRALLLPLLPLPMLLHLRNVHRCDAVHQIFVLIRPK
jgi:hypothetical protein